MKSKTLLIKLSPSEYNEIKAKATEAGISMSDLIRNSVLTQELPSSEVDYNCYCLLVKASEQLSQLKLSPQLGKQIELTLPVLRQAALKIVSS